MRTAGTRLAAAQAAYLVATGVAPLLSMRAFERITGPKTDDWLVKTVGLLAVGFGAVLARDAARGRPDPVVGVAGALPFAVVDLWYVGRGRISRIYLADTAVEAAFLAGWLAVAAGGTGRGRAPLGGRGPAPAAAFAPLSGSSGRHSGHLGTNQPPGGSSNARPAHLIRSAAGEGRSG